MLAFWLDTGDYEDLLIVEDHLKEDERLLTAPL